MPGLAVVDIDRVSDLMRTTAAVELLPRFRNLAAHEVREKRPGDLVTVADLASERRIAAGLARIAPGVPVVGEEAVSADPALVQQLKFADAAWLVDPLDGTSNFAAGRDRFAVIVAYVRKGETVAGWIYGPSTGTLAVATRGGGALLDGLEVRLEANRPLAHMRGSVGYKFIRTFRDAPSAASRQQIGELATMGCAGLEYIEILAGRRHFSLYRMTKPWDHAAGALLVEEAGGVSRRFNGEPYDPLQGSNAGILAAPSASRWGELYELLVAPALPLFPPD